MLVNIRCCGVCGLSGSLSALRVLSARSRALARSVRALSPTGQRCRERTARQCLGHRARRRARLAGTPGTRHRNGDSFRPAVQPVLADARQGRRTARAAWPAPFSFMHRTMRLCATAVRPKGSWFHLLRLGTAGRHQLHRVHIRPYALQNTPAPRRTDPAAVAWQ